MSTLELLEAIDSPELAAARKNELNISRHLALRLGKSAVKASSQGYYLNSMGEKVDWSLDVEKACRGKLSIPPDSPLSQNKNARFPITRVQVVNDTTLSASRRLIESGLGPLALNFANGVQPGGGFLTGALAQEETLCRSSSLYKTLVNDPMYEFHANRGRQDSTDWAIYSPQVPVFRTDDGSTLDHFWRLSFITCAAPYARSIGQPESGDLLKQRIHRLLAIAEALGYSTLVLGAWGCGAFFNDPNRTANDFRSAIEHEFNGAFSNITFAITDWSEERRFLGPFRDVFSLT